MLRKFKDKKDLDVLKRQLISKLREYICGQLDCEKGGSVVGAEFIKIIGKEDNLIKDPTKILKALAAKAIELRNTQLAVKNDQKYLDKDYQVVRIVRETMELYENIDKTDIMKAGYVPTIKVTKESIQHAIDFIDASLKEMAPPVGYGKP